MSLLANRRFELGDLRLETHYFVALGLENRFEISQLPAQIRQLYFVIANARIVRRDFRGAFGG